MKFAGFKKGKGEKKLKGEEYQILRTCEMCVLLAIILSLRKPSPRSVYVALALTELSCRRTQKQKARSAYRFIEITALTHLIHSLTEIQSTIIRYGQERM